MTIVQQKTKQIIDRHVAPYLKQQAFKKSGKTFFRYSEPYWLIINIQSSMLNFATSGQFTINLSRHDTRYDSEPATKPPKYYETKPYNAVRVGYLLDGKDKWWTVNEETDTDKLGMELVRIMQDKVLPCLESWGEFQGVRWTPSDF